MSEQIKKPRELLLYYTPIYNVIIQNWLFSLIERTLISLFASYQKNGCELSREVLKRHCECGPYHLERAVRRLEFMGIIEVQRGGKRSYNPPRRDTNRYFFQSDPYSWRVTKELQNRIAEETSQLGKSPRAFTHEGYADKNALDFAFGKSVPTYAHGKKGRRKQVRASKNEQTKPVAVQPPDSDDKKWLDRMAYILADDLSFISLASKYFQYADDIEIARHISDHGFSAHKLTYLERLHYIYTEQRTKLKNEEDIAVYNQVESWIDSGIPSGKISLNLDSLKREMKASKGE